MNICGTWFKAPSAQKIIRLLEGAGHQTYFVGGCVRNDLLGREVKDIDIASAAPPETMMALAKEAGIQAVPTGIKHGTVTLIVDSQSYEITTFRRDLLTDGRHAKVAFSSDLKEDAQRRDFTMNALYATADGTILDPLSGLEDLRAGRVRFINDADQRIKEDYLRILRYFRFSAWYGALSEGFDPGALAAITANLDGLNQLSKERIGAEMIKLLSAPDPSPSVAAMRATGVLNNILEGADDRLLSLFVHLEISNGLSPDPIGRLAVLGGQDVKHQLRLTNLQAKTFDILRECMSNTMPPHELGYRYGQHIAQMSIALRAAVFETQIMSSDLEAAIQGASAQFPLTGQDLTDRFEGVELGRVLKDCEAQWIASGFKLGKDDLLRLHR